MKKNKDIITEEEFTLRMAPLSSSPEDDSPGDSEADAGSEFQMGAEFLPEDTDEDSDEVTLSNIDDLNKKYANKPPARQLEELPDSAKVISSNQPSPWMDLDSNSDTN